MHVDELNCLVEHMDYNRPNAIDLETFSKGLRYRNVAGQNLCLSKQPAQGVPHTCHKPCGCDSLKNRASVRDRAVKGGSAGYIKPDRTASQIPRLTLNTTYRYYEG